MTMDLTWWQWVLVVAAVIVVLALLAGAKDIMRYMRIRNM